MCQLWDSNPHQMLYQLSYLDMYGGERGIRTPAALSRPVGFQDRSLQPGLGISPVKTKVMVDPVGFEPTTDRL